MDDLNNNSVSKTEAPPPFEVSFEEGTPEELKVLAIENHGSFYVKILGPKESLVDRRFEQFFCQQN